MQSQQPLTLSCGLRLPNRIVKAAMAEQLADTSGLPNERHFGAYKKWAEGGFGLVITGNVQIDPRYLGAPGDIFLPSSSSSAASKDALLTAWKSYAHACTNNNTISIVQINHPGRQSPLGAGSRGIFAKSIAPSAIALDFNGGIVGDVIQKVMFGCPRAMSKDEIAEVVSRFAQTAELAAEAGFHGCEIHAAHGYLLSQFMSAKTNVREDEYGGSAANRVRIVVEIIRAIREKVPKTFAVAIKLNSVDQQGEEMEDRLEQLRLLKETGGLDFIEVSGGTYESPTMNTGLPDTQTSARTKAREAFFLSFASTIKSQLPNLPLLVTGGFRSREGMESALAQGDCDLVGTARPAVLNPLHPSSVILNEAVPTAEAKLYARKMKAPWYLSWLKVKAVGASFENSWYVRQIQALG